MTITEKAYAKINLFLEVTGKRPDGYHDIVSVMQSVSLADTVTVTLTGENGILLTCDDPSLPTDGTNLAFRAAECFFTRFPSDNGAKIDIRKKIPYCAGLGGGSSDAAAVLRALNRLTGNRIPLSDLAALGARIGADVPFCTVGGTMLTTGTGTELSPIDNRTDCIYVIAKGNDFMSTAEAYAGIDRLAYTPVSEKDFLSALRTGNIVSLASRLFNRFEDSVQVSPEIRNIMKNNGAEAVLMSGSGTSVFGIFTDRAFADTAVNSLRKSGYFAESAVNITEKDIQNP